MRTIFATFLILAASAASAATYYVDDSGSNSNSGTLAAPFRTITYGLDFIEDPGDVLYVRGGLYSERAVIWNKHGTSTQKIRVEAYNDEEPVIDGSNVGAHSTVSINESSFIVFKGFTVQNAPETAILVWNAHHIDVEENMVDTAIKAGIHAGADVMGDTHDILFHKNSVTNTVRQNIPANNATDWMQAMSCFQASNVTMTENTIFQNYGEGIDCIVSDGCTIRQNLIWDNTGSNVYLDNAQDAVVDRNLIYHTGDSEYFRDGEASPGITVANEWYDTQNAASGLTITNNIVLKCLAGFVYYNSEYGGGLHDTLIANNTFYESRSSDYRLIYIEDDQWTNVHDTTTIVNNIFYQRSGVGYASAPTAGITWQTNNWYGGTANTWIAGSGDVTADPVLANPGSWNPAGYQLTSTSPLKTAGTTESLVSQDYFGTTRSASYSIGAHEY